MRPPFGFFYAVAAFYSRSGSFPNFFILLSCIQVVLFPLQEGFFFFPVMLTTLSLRLPFLEYYARPSGTYPVFGDIPVSRGSPFPTSRPSFNSRYPLPLASDPFPRYSSDFFSLRETLSFSRMVASFRFFDVASAGRIASPNAGCLHLLLAPPTPPTTPP